LWQLSNAKLNAKKPAFAGFFILCANIYIREFIILNAKKLQSVVHQKAIVTLHWYQFFLVLGFLFHKDLVIVSRH